MTKVDICNLCGSIIKDEIFKVKDFLVSGEEFSLIRCSKCSLISTSPRPDKNSIGKYYKSEDYISHFDKPKSLTDKIYFAVRKYMISKKINFIKKLKQEPISILDFGCGAGAFISECNKQGWAIAGYEPDDTARQICDKNNKIATFSNFEHLKNSKPEPFDVITMWHVLEHVQDIKETLSGLTNLLKHDGLLVIAVPEHNSFDAEFYKKYWAAYDVPRHLYHFNETTIKYSARMLNFDVIKKKPLIFDSFFVSMISENYKKNKLGIVRAAIIGLLSNLKGFFTNTPYSSQIYFLKKRYTDD